MKKDDRFYLSNGKQVPSGTTVIGIIDKPELVKWAANCAVDCILDTGPTDYGYGSIEIDKADADQARTAHHRVSREAKDYGTYIHKLCEYSLKHGVQIEMPRICPVCRNEFYLDTKTKCACGAVLKEPHEMTNKFMQGFWDWKTKHNVKVIAMEHEVLSEFYGGRLDLVCEMDSVWMTKAWCKKYGHKWYKGIEKQRVIVLVDWKTGKGSYYDNWKYQLSGYRAAYNKNVGEYGENNSIFGYYSDYAARHQGILKFNKGDKDGKGKGNVNYKDFTEYDATRTKEDGKFINGKLETEKYMRTHDIDYQTFYGFVRSWWLMNRGISI